MAKTENNLRTTVTKVPNSDFAYHFGLETTGLLSFLLPSGDGYSISELGKEVKAIAEYVRCNEKDVTLYSGLEYESIPFEDIYELWFRLYGGKDRVKPSYEEFNTYSHGFFHVLAFTEKDYLVKRDLK